MFGNRDDQYRRRTTSTPLLHLYARRRTSNVYPLILAKSSAVDNMLSARCRQHILIHFQKALDQRAMKYGGFEPSCAVMVVTFVA
jgi:hypothetical protein